MRRSLKSIVMAISLICATGATAQDKVASPNDAEPGRHALRIVLGFMVPEDESRIGDDDLSAMLNIAYEYRAHRNLGIGVELGSIARLYQTDTPPPGYFTDPDRDIEVEFGSIAATVRGLLPLDNVELYGGVGVGVYYSEMRITGETNNVEGAFFERDTGFGYFAMLGADIALARRHAISVELRRLYLKADFGPLSGGNVDIGGDVLAIGYQYRF